MSVRTLEMGSKGEDVRAIQIALNQNGANLDPDGNFGSHTRDAVIAFQKEEKKRNPKFSVDGKVGRQTRQALFPWIAVTVNVFGTRRPYSVRPGFSLPQLKPPSLPPQPDVNLQLPPLTLGAPELVKIPGLSDPLAFAPMRSLKAPILGKNWQQINQTQRQFTGLFRGPVLDTFAVGIQTVFNKKDSDNHPEFTTGCQLQRPIGLIVGQSYYTVACFANATWVDPILHRGMFHLVNPYAQIQAQGNVGGPILPTLQMGLFPVNINVDLNDDGLQFNLMGGAVWNLTFGDNGIKSTWGTVMGIGLTGKFQLF
jgi:hypothetical protein